MEWICLAGYLRLLSPAFVRRYPQRIVNIHPSLLPAFPGLHAQRQAWEHGVKVSGCTVHLVDEGLDSGPIVVQRAVAVDDGDTPERLAARILEEEHRAYPEAMRRLLGERWRVVGRRLVFDEARRASAASARGAARSPRSRDGRRAAKLVRTSFAQFLAFSYLPGSISPSKIVCSGSGRAGPGVQPAGQGRPP